jgi:hypothetical protein
MHISIDINPAASCSVILSDYTTIEVRNAMQCTIS